MSFNKIPSWVWLSIIIILGITLRIYQIGLNPYWHDEVWTIIYSRMSLSGIWHEFLIQEPTPPLYYVITHFAMLIGFNEYSFRIISTVFGVAMIPTVYLVAKEYINKYVGFIAAFLVAINPFTIYYSQEARTYTLMMLLVTCVLYCYIRFTKTKNSRWLAGMAVLSALAVWAQWFSGLAIAIIWIHMLITHVELKKVIATAGLTTVLIAPLIPIFFEHYVTRTHMPKTWGYPGFDSIVAMLMSMSGYTGIGIVIIGIAVILGLYVGWKHNKTFTSLLILGIVIPLIFGWLASYFVPMTPRYLAFIYPFYALAMAPALWGIYTSKILHNTDYTKIAAIVFSIIIVMSGIPFYVPYYTTITKFNWPAAVNVTKEYAQPGDYIIMIPSSIQIPLDYYYSNASAGTYLLPGDSMQEVNSTLIYTDSNVIYLVDIAVASERTAPIWVWFENNTKQVYGDSMGRIYYKHKIFNYTA